jgi:hypothetical protein
MLELLQAGDFTYVFPIACGAVAKIGKKLDLIERRRRLKSFFSPS